LGGEKVKLDVKQVVERWRVERVCVAVGIWRD
jgi:hypothetical protein